MEKMVFGLGCGGLSSVLILWDVYTLSIINTTVHACFHFLKRESRFRTMSQTRAFASDNQTSQPLREIHPATNLMIYSVHGTWSDVHHLVQEFECIPTHMRVDGKCQGVSVSEFEADMETCKAGVGAWQHGKSSDDMRLHLVTYANRTEVPVGVY